MSAQGQELLTSLVGFIQPIIRIYSSVSGEQKYFILCMKVSLIFHITADSAMTDEGAGAVIFRDTCSLIHQSLVRLQSDVQDRELLAALKSFVKSTVSAHSEFQGESESEHTEGKYASMYIVLRIMTKIQYRVANLILKYSLWRRHLVSESLP